MGRPHLGHAGARSDNCVEQSGQTIRAMTISFSCAAYRRDKRWFLSCTFAIKWSEAEWQKCKLKTIRLIALLN
jgi:hypothetical protein